MSHPPLQQPVTTENKSRPKSCLFGCLGTVIGIPILLIIIGYYVLMHTAVPLRLVAKVLDHDDQIKIEGLGGSISKGFTIETLRYSDDSGNESVLEGLTLQWGDIDRMRKNRELVIEEIGLRRAHIYVDTSEDTAETESKSSDTNADDTDEPGEKLNLFEIKKVNIRAVVIESTTGDFKLELDEILMKGFRIKDDEFNLASLTVGSNFLDLNLEDAETVTIAGEQVPFKRQIVGILKPEMHESLAKEIDFTIELGALAGEMATRVRCFNGSVEAVNLGPLGYEAITFKDFTPADYLAPESSGPVSKLSMEIRTVPEGDSETGLRSTQLESGSLTLGTALFTMAPQVLKVQHKDQAEIEQQSESIVATSQLGGLEITATLNEAQEPPFFQVDLSSEPTREQRDLIALLWFGKAYGDLTPDQAAAVGATEKRHFPPKE
jgi:hypothetical protein